MHLPITQLLDKSNVPYKLIKLNQVAISVDDVVSYSNGEVVREQICKTLIVKGKKTSNKYGIFLLGDDKIDFKKLKQIFNEEMTMADFQEVKEVAGVEPGAVCPFMIDAPLYVDQKVTSLEAVNCGSGDHLFGIEFKLKDLGKVSVYEVIDCAK